jgi:hydroxymethylpyrimidine/phosphomethylpyrimidine kinase
MKNIDHYAHYHEIIQLSPAETNAENTAKMLSAHCAILLKGGHHPEKLVSILYIQKRDHPVFTQKIIAHRKHGSGCVYRLLLFLTLLWKDLRTACYLAKDYIETYLQSTQLN